LTLVCIYVVMYVGVKPQTIEKDHGMYECIKREIRQIMNTDIDKVPKQILSILINDKK
jgi:hypothetical protein